MWGKDIVPSSNSHQEIVEQLELILARSTVDTQSQLKIPPKIAKTATWNKLNLWQIALRAIAVSNWWQFCLITIGSVSSLIFPHPPLVGLAAVAGNTLTRKKALITVMSIWVANQFYGFSIRAYPLTLTSLTWGLVMGSSILFVTWLITLQPKFSRHNIQGYLIWLAVGLFGGYALYQGSILLIAQLMGGHGLSGAILWRIFVKDLVWATSLSIFHGCALTAIALKLLKQIMQR
jgi:hypothetical protein